jgi:predicted ArsR family transcriptional regulator
VLAVELTPQPNALRPIHIFRQKIQHAHFDDDDDDETMLIASFVSQVTGMATVNRRTKAESRSGV